MSNPLFTGGKKVVIESRVSGVLSSLSRRILSDLPRPGLPLTLSETDHSITVEVPGKYYSKVLEYLSSLLPKIKGGAR